MASATDESLETLVSVPTAVVAWSESSSPAWAVGTDAGDGEGELDVVSGVLLPALYLLVCLCGLSGNALVAVAVVARDRVSSATSVYVLTLALADGLFMLGLPLLAAQSLLGRWPFGETACRLTLLLDGSNQLTSAFCLTAMSLDRYATLGRPTRRFSSAWRRPRRAGLVALLLWLLSLVPVLPVATHFSARSGYCALDAELAAGADGLAFLTAAFILGFVLPLGVMVTTYGALAWRWRAGGAAAAVVTETERVERRLATMVAAVAGVFGACWTPFYLLNFLALGLGEVVVATEAFVRCFEASVLLSYSWSCANPLLYAAFSPTLRRHFRTLLCPRKNTCQLTHSHHCHLSHTHTEHYDLNHTHTELDDPAHHTHTQHYSLSSDPAPPAPGEVV